VPEFSAFCLVMEDISSREAEVSSWEAACSEAPSANSWPLPATCPEEAETWEAPYLLGRSGIPRLRDASLVQLMKATLNSRYPKFTQNG